MALIKCPECGKEISDTAKACIHCGYVLHKNKSFIELLKKVELNKLKKIGFAVIAAIVFIICIIGVNELNRNPIEKEADRYIKALKKIDSVESVDAVACISREIYGNEENSLGYVIFYSTKNESEFAYFENNTYLGNGYNSGITDKIKKDSPFLDKNGTEFNNMLALHEMITALEFIDDNNLEEATCEEFYEVEEGVVYIKLIEIEKWLENK